MANTLLVEGRECGDCVACCVELTIEDPELVKLPGVACEHLLKKGGCSIYQTRPETCKNWYCMWRFMPLLDDGWRPDLKGVLIKRVFDNIPPGYEGKIALAFEIIGNKSVLHDMNFIEVVGGYIVQGFPCFLSYGRPNFVSRMVLLNDKLRPAIEGRNLPQIKKLLSSALKSCAGHPSVRLMISKGKVIGLNPTMKK